MVIEGSFYRASYHHDAPKTTRVTLDLLLHNDELLKLQNALANRRENLIRMVINSSAVAVADAKDTPATSTESW